MSEQRLWIAALAFFLAFAIVGAYVAGRPPAPIDVAGGAVRGEAVPLAEFFTLLGRWYVLPFVAAVAAVVTIALRGDLRAIVLLFVSQVVAQGVVAGIKLIFHRARPGQWLVVRETDYSYPSGHAVTTIVFYFALLLLAVRSGIVPRPLLVPLALVLGACLAGIPWSRLALGAHYVTDVTGGLLFGCGWLCATLAIVQRVTTMSRINP